MVSIVASFHKTEDLFVELNNRSKELFFEIILRTRLKALVPVFLINLFLEYLESLLFSSVPSIADFRITTLIFLIPLNVDSPKLNSLPFQ